jgi:hypothetical protein
LHSSFARRAIKSNTGCVSSGVLDITFSTSMVAACCSIRSPNSLLRSASAAVRSCSARYVSALPMAITACSAKVCNNAIWLSVKPPFSLELIETQPITAPSRSIGTASTDFSVPREAGLISCSASRSRM